MVNTALIAELANAQGEAYINGTRLPWTAGKVKDYALFSLLMQGRGRDSSFTSGTSIKTLFDPQISSSGFAPKRHAEDHKRGTGGTVYEMSTPLSEYEWNKGITWHQIALQNGIGNPFDGGSGSQQFWSILQKTEKDFRLDPVIKMEAELGATPVSRMFSPDATGKYQLKSLWTGINLWDTTHGVAGEGLFPGMTSQQGLDPEQAEFQRTDGFGSSQLACHKVSYGDIGNNSTTGDDHIYDRMQYFIDTLGWEPTPMAGEWADGMDVNPSYFLCSHEAKVQLQVTNRAHGELFAILNPFRDPAQSEAQFQGIPLRCSSTVRNMAVYPDTQGGTDAINAVNRDPVTEFDTDGTPGPVFYAIDPRSVKLHMHAERSWVEGPWKTMEPVNEDEMRKLGKFLGNIHFESFVTNGILYPSTAVSGYSKIAS